ncbi:MAG: hypothetical protein JRH10_06880 [Deltaproteobacteria bacterium]|nr:hypothetical protein [Deltaproteobacteria bacterium]MBW2446870.1 hypothetical protein [Deltaproteobacteria bacterium]
MSTLQYREVEAWPPLAWLAVCESAHDDVLVLHGTQVEAHPEWFCEAVWDGEFEEGGFDQNDRVYGSGGRLREGRLRFVSCGVTFDRLHHVVRGGRTFVSNSLACLATGTELELDVTHPHYLKDFMSIKRGYRGCVRQIVTSEEPIELTYYDDLVWVDGRLEAEPKQREKADLGSYDSYRRFMASALEGLFANARSAARRHRYEPLVAISSGMDSGTAAALSVPHGLREGFTFRTARRGKEDSGQSMAKALGIEVETFERDDWHRYDLPEVPFLLGDARGPDVFYRSAENLIAGRLLLTGYTGGGLWTTRKRLSADTMPRVDTSGLSLAEYRLWVGALHLPVPAIGYAQMAEVEAISFQPEMERWRVPRSYDKPIARRVLVEAGVEPDSVARYNRASTVLWVGESTFLSDASREDFAGWLRRNEERLVQAHGGPPVADLPRGGPDVAVGRRLAEFARSAPGRQHGMKAIARWLLRGADPTPLMRYFLPWAMEHGRRRYGSPDLSR